MLVIIVLACFANCLCVCPWYGEAFGDGKTALGPWQNSNPLTSKFLLVVVRGLCQDSKHSCLLGLNLFALPRSGCTHAR
jgi:hypothetical protein